MPFIVKRAIGTPAPVLFVSAAITWQAYNRGVAPTCTTRRMADSATISRAVRAVQVSFDRPHCRPPGSRLPATLGAAVRPLAGTRGASTSTTRPTSTSSSIRTILSGRRLIVFAGHHEYWSRPMRTALEAAVAAGVNVAFLSGNEVYWQVRLEALAAWSRPPDHLLQVGALDPLAAVQPALTTCRFRDMPVNDPEAPLVGQMYGHIVERPADWVVAQRRPLALRGDGPAQRRPPGQPGRTGIRHRIFLELANPGDRRPGQQPGRSGVRIAA